MSNELTGRQRPVRRKREVRYVELSGEQLYELERLWYVYGNNRPQHTPGNHQFIQCLYERGEDIRLLCNKSTMPTPECVGAVEKILARDFSTNHLTDTQRKVRDDSVSEILRVRDDYQKPVSTRKGGKQ